MKRSPTGCHSGENHLSARKPSDFPLLVIYAYLRNQLNQTRADRIIPGCVSGREIRVEGVDEGLKRLNQCEESKSVEPLHLVLSFQLFFLCLAKT